MSSARLNLRSSAECDPVLVSIQAALLRIKCAFLRHGASAIFPALAEIRAMLMLARVRAVTAAPEARKKIVKKGRLSSWQHLVEGLKTLHQSSAVVAELVDAQR